jgi:2-oxoglutarate ferredoxin oxidoreductase subunit delta
MQGFIIKASIRPGTGLKGISFCGKSGMDFATDCLLRTPGNSKLSHNTLKDWNYLPKGAGSMYRITINRRWCKKCGICTEFCPANVFAREADGTPVAAHREKCTGCRICVLRCPDFALEVEVDSDDGNR